MTLVVAIDYLDELLVIADTRVSYPNKQYETTRGLKKLFIVSDRFNMAILGFAGNLSAVKPVIEHIWTKKLPNYKRRFVMPHFKDDLKRWIEEITKKLDTDTLKGLSFILCALELHRRRPMRSASGEVVSSQFYERHVYTYRVDGNGLVKIQPEGAVAIIGSGKELTPEIKENVLGLINFGRTMPNYHTARSFIVSTIISQIFEDKESETVGGPFQILGIIPPDKFQWAYQWSPTGENKIEVIHDGDKTLMKNLSTGETCVLLPIWDWL